MKKRIWELDALRGLCILGVLAVHLVYDLVELFGILPWEYPEWFSLLKNWGGVIFLIISGTCVTLGSHPVRRGAIVFGCGMLCTLVTWAMTVTMGFHHSLSIWFGVLHCLGVCMLLWPAFKGLPWWALAAIGALLVALGFWVDGLLVQTPWMIFLGLKYPGFATSDYFPLLPHLGFFLLGSVLGRTLYKKKESLLPGVSPKNILVRSLSFCGRHSLWIYLLHQPVLYGICSIFCQ